MQLVTEKEMEVFGIHLPERCVLTYNSSDVLQKDDKDKRSILASTQETYGELNQKVLDLNGVCSTADFIGEVIKQNGFIPRTGLNFSVINDMKKLRLIIKNGEKFVTMEGQIDYTPSKGLIIYEPVIGVIGTVVFDKNGFTAQLEHTLEPTNPVEQIKHLKGIGFTEIG